MISHLFGSIISGIIAAVVFYILGVIFVQVDVNFVHQLGEFFKQWFAILGLIVFVLTLVGLRARMA